MGQEIRYFLHKEKMFKIKKNCFCVIYPIQDYKYMQFKLKMGHQ